MQPRCLHCWQGYKGYQECFHVTDVRYILREIANVWLRVGSAKLDILQAVRLLSRVYHSNFESALLFFTSTEDNPTQTELTKPLF